MVVIRYTIPTWQKQNLKFALFAGAKAGRRRTARARVSLTASAKRCPSFAPPAGHKAEITSPEFSGRSGSAPRNQRDQIR